MSVPRVAVITVSYNHAHFLRDLFASFEKVSYPKDSWKVWLLDNVSKDNTVELAKTELLNASLTATRGGIRTKLVANTENTGFAGGNNQCVKEAFEEGFDFVYLLNPDTEVEPDFLEKAVAAASDPTVAAVQSMLVLGQDREKVNSIGNAYHFLGFSYCLGYQDSIHSPAVKALLDTTPDILVASGAGVMFRVDALKKVGLLNETLFAYHEDVELSLRLWLVGYRVVLAPSSIVYHKYEFSRSIKKYYWMERNRWIVFLTTLRLRTILLILPMQIVMEMGLTFFAFRSGWWREKFRVIGWFFNVRHLYGLLKMRHQIQKMRIMPDRELAKHFATSISYQEIDNPLLRYVGNPLMKLYWSIIRPIIRW